MPYTRRTASGVYKWKINSPSRGDGWRYPTEGFVWYTAAMPRISEFYGIAVYIYYRDHNPPHFHAIYGDSEAIVEIRTGAILEGKLPRRAAKLVGEWSELHRDALLADWALAEAQQPLLPIEPLD